MKDGLMKIQKSLKFSLFYILFTFCVQAEIDSSFKHDFSLGIEVMKYFYKEPNIRQDVYSRQLGAVWMDNNGYLFGFNGSYRLTLQDKIFVQPEGRILYGKSNYRTGRKEKVWSTTKREEPTLLYETRLLTGGVIPLIYKLTLSPYTGIGYRFKNDDSEKLRTSRGNLLGYYRKSNYVYVPLGAYIDYVINDTWSVSLKGEYDWMIKGWQYTRSMKLYKPLTNKQSNGYGLKGEVSISYLYKKVQFSVSPYINYWNIRNSKVVTMPYPYGGAREPYNITWESGVRLEVAF
jgi:hypothetical protein